MASMRWTNHLQTEEDKEKFLRLLRSNKTLLRRLEALIQEEYNVSDKAMHDRDNFTLPAWSEKQAYELGYQKALKGILSLLKT